MEREDARDLEIRGLRERLSRLSEASLRINETLDLDTVLREALDSARDLTGSRYGVFILLDDAGRMQEFFGSGMTPEQGRKQWAEPDRNRFFDYVGRNSEAAATAGLPQPRPDAGSARVPPAHAGGLPPVLSGRSHPPPGRAPGHHLP